MDINNVQDLKAYAYDLLVRIQATQKELEAVNQQIAKQSQPAPVQPQVETPKVETPAEEVKTN
jgi:hypothetical protein